MGGGCKQTQSRAVGLKGVLNCAVKEAPGR